MLEQFMIDSYLKKGQTLEGNPRQITENIVEYTITKQTARTYKPVALLKVGTALLHSSTLPSKLLTYKFTLHSKRQLDEPFPTIRAWLAEGWVVEVIDFQPDGRTAKDSYYRMGPSYIRYLQQKESEQQQQLEAERQQWIGYLKNCTFHPDLQPMIHLLESFLSKSISELAQDKTMKETWSIQKRLKFLLFSIGFFQLASQENVFDFKQIGATVFDVIGGSKVFDREREEFIEEVERVFEIDTTIWGLVSLGKIVPVYFSGQLQGRLSQYMYGAVHALTDDSLLQDSYQTTAKHVFLVENRAVLTRMVKEPQFLENTQSLVICLDGQIRSAHKTLLQQLLAAQQIEQVIIWTDYDEAGLIIARHAAKIAAGCQLKIIARDFTAYSSIEAYEAWFQTECQNEHEQEQQLGGEEQWYEWIQM